MSTAILILAIAAPALTAPLLYVSGGVAGRLSRLAPYAALPTLLLAALPIGYSPLRIGWLLTGSLFEVDAVGRAFLLAAAAVWSAAGIYAATDVAPPEKRRWLVFFLPAMTGSLGLTIAADASTFYVFFALLTFAGYGLVVHHGGPVAARAGRVYLTLAVVGEAFLLGGLLLAADAARSAPLAAIPAAIAASPSALPITALLFLGFAVKAGALPFHVWMPLAYSAAPIPAAAALAGAMGAAGALGWLRFLPLGLVSLPSLAAALIGLGALGALYGVLVGLAQTDPRTTLAYSSISQSGLVIVGIGIGLAGSALPNETIASITLYAVHHGVAKGALFLGVGVLAAEHARGPWRRLGSVGLAIPALALAGLPLTIGHAAKAGLKSMAYAAPGNWATLLAIFLPVASAATALLMIRFLSLATAGEAERTRGGASPGVRGPWLALLVGYLALHWLIGPEAAGGSIASELIPIAVGIAAYLVAATLRPRWAAGAAPARIPPGDVLYPAEALLAAAAKRLFPRPDRPSDRRLVPGIALRWYRLYSDSEPDDRLIRAELALTTWAAGLTFALILGALILAFLAGGAP